MPLIIDQSLAVGFIPINTRQQRAALPFKPGVLVRKEYNDDITFSSIFMFAKPSCDVLQPKPAATSALKALPGKLDIKRHSPSIRYISASHGMSTSVLKALPGKLDIKRHSPSLLCISASLGLSTSILKALPVKLDIKSHSPSILYIQKLKR